MRDFADRVKRLLVGRSVPSRAAGRTPLPKRIALPVLGADVLSSVAYAPDEILLTLAVAGLAATAVSPWVALAVAGVLLLVVASYRQTIHAYPSGGGDYEVVSKNLGQRAGLMVASALISDFVLTVAVSISSAAGYLVAAVPALATHRVEIAVGIVTVLTLMNLRASRGPGRGAALPAYLYMGAIGVMAVVGAFQELTGTLGRAPSAAYEVVAQSGWDQGLTGLAGAFLVLRAWSCGCAALTGVEAIPGGVPSFQRPKASNAATTLLLLGVIAAVMLIGVVHLAGAVGVHMVDNPATDLLDAGAPLGEDYHQYPVIGQVAAAVFVGFPPMFYLVTLTTGLILVMAARSAFKGLPVLTGTLSGKEFLPRRPSKRGDQPDARGAMVLWVGAIAFIVGFQANTNRLIQLYIVGVFICFTLSQMGMLRHWNRQLSTATDPVGRRRMRRSRLINGMGVVGTGAVLVIVLLTEFTRGVWIAVAVIALLYLVMTGIHSHYRRFGDQVAIDDSSDALPAPAHVHAIVLVSRLHRPALRALTYALSTQPRSIEAVTVDTGDGVAQGLLDDWEHAELPVPLTILDSPYRDVTGPIVSYVRSLRRESPRDLVVVFLPEYLVRHWWQRALHNRTALPLKAALLLTPGVVVASVPWRLGLPGQTYIHQGLRITAPRGITDTDGANRTPPPTAQAAQATSDHPHLRTTPQENA
ncbi:APC family permease [Actinomyces qiguomingii]|uniref:APC family permease n=1 Tax=Actinomyces qiguomingii TaxID=2057800 RepID=UPI000CA072ED|nr:APC family permease [Actinomyces qiguomingii]